MPNPFRLSSRLFGDIFWSGIFAESDALEPLKGHFLKEMLELERLRQGAEYNTGSISWFSSWLLFSLSKYFGFRRSIEIGTFIGRSSISIAKAMNLIGGGEIHTCDMSNDIDLPKQSPTKIVQYKKQSSSEMLKALDGLFDFVFLDGRLSEDDVARLPGLIEDNAVIALDDFEGVEKGVANLFNLRSNSRFQHLFLVPPPTQHFAERMGFTSYSVVAVLIPSSLVTLVNQG